MTARALPSLDEPKRAFKGVWIPSEIWLNKRLSWLEKCILAEIDSLDDGKGCWASNDFLATRMGITKLAIKIKISRLKKDGFLREIAPPEGVERRFLKVRHGFVHETSGFVHETGGVPVRNHCSIPNSEIYSVNAGELLGLHVEEIPIEIPISNTPLVPQGGNRKKVPDVPVEIRDIAARFWTENPSTRPVGEKETSKHFRDLQALIAFGISEAQLFRARSLLSADKFRADWVCDLSAILKNWTRIAGRLNGELKDPDTKASVFNIKAVLKAKEDKAAQIKQKNSAEVAMGTVWSNETAKSDYFRLRKEIRSLNDQLAEAL